MFDQTLKTAKKRGGISRGGGGGISMISTTSNVFCSFEILLLVKKLMQDTGRYSKR